MPVFTGDITNLPPNQIQEPLDRSEKLIDINRAEQVRRDVDNIGNFTISLYDIDQAIFDQLNQLQLQVQDSGKQIKVPVFFGSPEQWKSAQIDGYIRDQQGKLILPALILKRTSSENDSTLQFFNRYLNAKVMQLHSIKNQYTQFNLLAGQNTHVHEVYNIRIPSHMLLTYHFIIWTEYVEQMNKLVETIQFSNKDYWGSRKGFRFRIRIENFSHTTELKSGDDRIVKTEFDLTTHGYILPDTMTKLEKHEMTTRKSFTPKKIIIGTEMVGTSKDWEKLKIGRNRKKWRNPDYPNLYFDEKIPKPPVSFLPQPLYQYNNDTTNPCGNFMFHFPPPKSSGDYGQCSWVSYDTDYYYIYLNEISLWKRFPIDLFKDISNNIVINPYGNFTYHFPFPQCYTDPGEENWVSYDTDYYYIYLGEVAKWKKIPIALFNYGNIF